MEGATFNHVVTWYPQDLVVGSVLGATAWSLPRPSEDPSDRGGWQKTPSLRHFFQGCRRCEIADMRTAQAGAR
ncbi:predicted protein [Plenodomus lingam JN3]|uniref:Predicted protein n=2 Tax=Leptosphaeria maculans TaxID=5022 RepID=E4ZT60_LEPMJ|nr:predicted protein [Plenodomus lingam JN3]CBX94491.1 predicted protein [Plenodomus lingam JN3]